jgi:hypothetical protein
MPEPTPADLEQIEAQLLAMGVGGRLLADERRRLLEEWRSQVTECELPRRDASPL